MDPLDLYFTCSCDCLCELLQNVSETLCSFLVLSAELFSFFALLVFCEMKTIKLNKQEKEN